MRWLQPPHFDVTTLVRISTSFLKVRTAHTIFFPFRTMNPLAINEDRFRVVIGGSISIDPMPVSDEEGEVAGVTYRVRGSGPPLILLPIEYSCSQWEPITPQLAQHYSIITLGGAWLGVVAVMEARVRGGYIEAVRKVVEETQLRPGERVLDVCCGPRKSRPMVSSSHWPTQSREWISAHI